MRLYRPQVSNTPIPTSPTRHCYGIAASALDSRIPTSTTTQVVHQYSSAERPAAIRSSKPQLGP